MKKLKTLRPYDAILCETPEEYERILKGLKLDDIIKTSWDKHKEDTCIYPSHRYAENKLYLPLFYGVGYSSKLFDGSLISITEFSENDEIYIKTLEEFDRIIDLLRSLPFPPKKLPKSKHWLKYKEYTRLSLDTMKCSSVYKGEYLGTHSHLITK